MVFEIFKNKCGVYGVSEALFDDLAVKKVGNHDFSTTFSREGRRRKSAVATFFPPISRETRSDVSTPVSRDSRRLYVPKPSGPRVRLRGRLKPLATRESPERRPPNVEAACWSR